MTITSSTKTGSSDDLGDFCAFPLELLERCLKPLSLGDLLEVARVNRVFREIVDSMVMERPGVRQQLEASRVFQWQRTLHQEDPLSSLRLFFRLHNQFLSTMLGLDQSAINLHSRSIGCDHERIWAIKNSGDCNISKNRKKMRQMWERISSSLIPLTIQGSSVVLPGGLTFLLPENEDSAVERVKRDSLLHQLIPLRRLGDLLPVVPSPFSHPTPEPLLKRLDQMTLLLQTYRECIRKEMFWELRDSGYNFLRNLEPYVLETLLHVPSYRDLILDIVCTFMHIPEWVHLNIPEWVHTNSVLLRHPLRIDRLFILRAVQKDERFFLLADTSLQQDPEIYWCAVRAAPILLQQSHLFMHLPDARDLYLEGIRRDPTAGAQIFRTVSPVWQDDDEMVLCAVHNKINGGCALQYASNRLRNRRAVVEAALGSENPGDFRDVGDALRQDPSILELAIARGWFFVLEACPESLRSDRNFLLRYLSSYRPFSSRRPPILWPPEVIQIRTYIEATQDRSFALELMKRNGAMLCCLPPVLANHSDVIQTALTQCGAAIVQLSFEKQMNPEFARIALTQDPTVLKGIGVYHLNLRIPKQAERFKEFVLFAFAQATLQNRDIDWYGILPDAISSDPEVRVAFAKYVERRRA